MQPGCSHLGWCYDKIQLDNLDALTWRQGTRQRKSAPMQQSRLHFVCRSSGADSGTDAQYDLSHYVSLFDPAMRLDNIFKREYLGPEWNRPRIDRSIQPLECLT
jgi:hypothetical protein